MSSDGPTLLDSTSLLRPNVATPVRYGTNNASTFSIDSLDETPPSGYHRIGANVAPEVPNFRPVVLRWWFLAGLSILFAIFGGLIELAIHTLPVKDTALTLFSRSFDGQHFGANVTRAWASQGQLDHVSAITQGSPKTSTRHGLTENVFDENRNNGINNLYQRLMTRKKNGMALIRPKPQATSSIPLPIFTTQAPERPLRDFGHHLYQLEPRIPSGSDFGSFGSVIVTYSSSHPPLSRPPPPPPPTTTTPTFIPSNTSEEPPLSTLTIIQSDDSTIPPVSRTTSVPTSRGFSTHVSHSTRPSASHQDTQSPTGATGRILSTSSVKSASHRSRGGTRSLGTEIPKTMNTKKPQSDEQASTSSTATGIPVSRSTTALSSTKQVVVDIIEVSSGIPTSTLMFEISPTPVTSTLTDLNGTPTATTTISNVFKTIVETLTDSGGTPTATETLVPELTSTTATLTGYSGSLTTTVTYTLPITSSLITQTDSKGSPTRTLTLIPISLVPASNVTFTTMTTSATPAPTDTGDIDIFTQHFFISQADYFLGTFAGILITTLFSIPIRMVNLNAQLLQPFHELASTVGAPAAYTLCREAGSLSALLQDIRQVFRGRVPLTLLTALMAFSSAVTTTFSSEALVLVLHGSCRHGGGSAANCAWTLGVATAGARVTEALLFFMSVQLVLSLLLLRRWRSGVAASPWSIGGIMSLLGHPEIRYVLGSLPTWGSKVSNENIQRELSPNSFKLDYFDAGAGQLQYGIIVVRGGDFDVETKKSVFSFAFASTLKTFFKKPRWNRRGAPQPFFILSIPGRLLILAFILGIIALVGYYNGPTTSRSFETFLDSESFGVRLLFTAIGVVVTLSWEALFTAVAYLSTYMRMAKSPQTARHSLAISPPTNTFSGFYSALIERDLFLGLVTFAGILSEFLPVLLSNVPYQVTQTLDVHLVSTWISVAILVTMLLVTVGSFFVHWPLFPVDVRTIAGAAYYLCDSRLLQTMVTSGVTIDRQLNTNEDTFKRRYVFGEMIGVSGRRRIGVDTDHGFSGTEGTSLTRQINFLQRGR